MKKKMMMMLLLLFGGGGEQDDHHVLPSTGLRDAQRLTFPAARASRWMPELFPEKRG